MNLLTEKYSLLSLLGAAVIGYVLGQIRGSSPRRTEERKREQRAETASTREHLVRLAPALRDSIEALVAKGQLIEAIRDLRHATGLGLKESKDVVDLIAEKIPHGSRSVK
jgi:ribosomal protein L7/L12